MKTDKKIEEIYMDTLKLTDDEWVAKYGEGNGYQEAFETLIQEERKEAVEGFVGWTQLNTPVSARDVERLRELVKEYLESEGK